MGLRYSYDLVFHQESLQGVIAELELLHGDKIEPLPYENSPHETDCLGLPFVVDGVIKKHWNHPNFKGDIGDTASIGCIWFTIYQGEENYGPENPEWLRLTFSVASKSMNPMVEESENFRKPFLDLLEKNAGIYGVLNRVNDAQLFWFEGKRCSIEFDDALLPYEEVRAIYQSSL